MRRRFDISLIDESDPFELDHGNRPHLAQHPGLTADDAYELWAAPDRVIGPAPLDKGVADWIVLAGILDVVGALFLAPPNSRDVTKCRPIGLYSAGDALVLYYLEHRP